MAQYKFPNKDVSIIEGYTYLSITNHLAEVDESNADLMKIVRRMDGIKVKLIRSKRGKK